MTVGFGRTSNAAYVMWSRAPSSLRVKPLAHNGVPTTMVAHCLQRGV